MYKGNYSRTYIKNTKGLTMIHSESIVKLAEALSKAQGEMENPVFDCVNPHYKSKYSSLAAIRNATIPIFNKHGIAVIQHLTATERGIKCGVILIHTSGEKLELEPLEVPSTKQDAQGLLSAGTYAQRRTLQGVSGVVGDEDDDANAASITKVDKITSIPKDSPVTPTKPVGDTPPPEEPKKDLHTLQNELFQLAEIARDAGRYKNEGEAVFAWTSYRDKKSGEVKGFKSVTSLKHEWQVTGAIERAKEDLNAKVPSDPNDPEWIK